MGNYENLNDIEQYTPLKEEYNEFDSARAEKYKLASVMISEKDKSFYKSLGLDASDTMQMFCDLRKNCSMSDDKENKYLSSNVKRPVDILVNGYHGISDDEKFGRACQARFNLDSSKMNETHFRRILAYSSGGSFNHPENADGAAYQCFLERFPTAMDYDEFSDEFLGRIVEANKGNGNKGAEYIEDMERFKNLMYGDQQKTFKVMKEMNKEAESKGRLFGEIMNNVSSVELNNIVGQEKQEVLGIDDMSDDVGVGVFSASSRLERDDLPVENSLKYSNSLPKGYQIISGGYENERALYRDWKNFLDELGYTSRRLEDGNYYCVKDDNNY